ncbi:MCE family protein [Nocardia uniformis]|uniref:MCE family protein n=1 Tax=Nocardia uniformis TaxID=53432 RepID=A0A849C0E0_9NOCA|nr:MlaD family protein [Nocardia uniformis]NNH70916.1 MCE family protein [Nocardia uniformis]
MSSYKDLSGRSAGPALLALTGIATVILALVLGLTLRAYQRGDFRQDFRFTIEAEQLGEGLADGADVKMRGFAIGRITAISFLGSGRQRLEAEVRPPFAAEIRDNLTARFVSSNIFGATGIELRPGNGPGQPLSPGGVLRIAADSQSVAVTALMRTIGEFAQLFERTKLDTVLTSLADSTPALAESFRLLLQLSQAIRETDPDARVAVGSMIGDLAAVTAASSVLMATAPGPLREMLNGTGFLVDKRTEAIATMTGLTQIGDVLAPFVGQQGGDISRIIDGLLAIIMPVAGTLRTVPAAFMNLGTLAERINNAFPTVNGTVVLHLDLTLSKLAFLPYSAGLLTGGGER